MNFLLDANLALGLAKALKRAGHEAAHVQDCGLLRATDRDIWKYAAKTWSIVVSKDADFAAMHMHAVRGSAVVWLRLGNAADDALIAAVVRALPEIAAAIAAGEGVVEVR